MARGWDLSRYKSSPAGVQRFTLPGLPQARSQKLCSCVHACKAQRAAAESKFFNLEHQVMLWCALVADSTSSSFVFSASKSNRSYPIRISQTASSFAAVADAHRSSNRVDRGD